MKCQRCPKQATLHITEVLGEDRYDEVHLCEDCAKKYLYEPQKQAAAKASIFAHAAVQVPRRPRGRKGPIKALVAIVLVVGLGLAVALTRFGGDRPGVREVLRPQPSAPP